LEGAAEQLSNVAHVQTAHEIEAMHFDRPHADLQNGGDFTVCMSHRNQAKDVALARREEIQFRLVKDRLSLSA